MDAPKFPYLTPVDRRMNIHTVKVFGHGLCLVCLGCGRHSHVLYEAIKDKGGMHGDMTPIYALKFRCSKCNTYLNERYLPGGSDSVERFLDEGMR